MLNYSLRSALPSAKPFPPRMNTSEKKEQKWGNFGRPLPSGNIVNGRKRAFDEVKMDLPRS
jgi:hypothetical protein